MNPSTALRTGGRLLWERSASVIPLYLLVSGLYGIARVPFLLAGLLAVWYLAAAGRLEPFVDALRRLGEQSAPTAPDATDVERVAPELGEAVAGLLTPETIALVAVGGFLSLLLAVLVSAVGNAAAVGGLYGLLRDEDGVRAGVDGARRYWRSILGVRLLLFVALAAVALPIVGFFAAVGGYLTSAVASVSTAGTAPSWAALGAGALALLFGLLVGALLVAAVFVLFAFAEQAVVVDDVGAVEAVRRSVRFPLRRPWDALGYVAVAFGALVVSGSIGGSAAAFGATRVTALVGAVLLPPVVDGFKTALYAERELPATDVSRPEDRLRSAFGGGLHSVGKFVRDRPFANLASLVTIAAGGLVGWRATSSLGTSIPIGGDVGSVFGSFPLGTFFNLAVNNWLVAADLAYGGLAVGIPALVGLAFNGLVVGAIGGVFDPVAFVALVAPHGIVEIPAIVVGGALGLRLGGVVLGVLRGRRDGDDVAAAIRRAYRVLLGLVPLFVLAAFVEAFLTPAIASLVLGG
ncbi:stage II sporulation protein M [Halobellus limi]|uniref:Stage II sporulation protein M n=1 Tax=Halobellus limi TaxID=699433 RepID=A0A1H5WSM4_9EURY|nr:stage II sporulation protein M [Halobellus limi]SEG02424.1 Stage II sporulation protein M [Halobellus limi]